MSPTALIVLGTAGIAFSPILVKAITAGPSVSAFWRCAISAVCLLGYAAYRERGRGRGAPLPWRLLLLSGAAFAMDLFVWHRSIMYAGAGLGTILANTQVFYVALGGILLLGERPTARFLAAIPLAFFGIVLLVQLPAAQLGYPYFRRGVVYGLMTGIFYCVFLLSLRQAQVGRDASEFPRLLAIIMGIAGIALAGLLTAEGGWRAPAGLEWLWVALLGAFVGAFAWMLITENLSKVQISRVGLILLLQPVLAALLGVLIYGEDWSPVQIAGGALTLGAIYMGLTSQARD